MTDRPLDSWMTSAPGAFLSIRPGGPFDAAAVSISAAAEPGRLVEASWKRDGERMASETLDDFEEARTLAHVWADQLAAGIEPETT